MAIPISKISVDRCRLRTTIVDSSVITSLIRVVFNLITFERPDDLSVCIRIFRFNFYIFHGWFKYGILCAFRFIRSVHRLIKLSILLSKIGGEVLGLVDLIDFSVICLWLVWKELESFINYRWDRSVPIYGYKLYLFQSYFRSCLFRGVILKIP